MLYLLVLNLKFILYLPHKTLKVKPKITHPKTKEFIDLISLYSTDWNEWVISGACILKEKEIIIVNNFLLTGTHLASCIELNITISSASNIFVRSKRRLKFHYPKFQRWVTERYLEKWGIITYISDSHRFLNSPLEDLPIKNQLKNILQNLCVETMGELLSAYTEIELKRIRGFGNTRSNEFKLLLKENNCLHLFNKG